MKPRKTTAKSSFGVSLIKFGLTILTLLALCLGAAIIYFNGERVRAPLTQLLHEVTGQEFTIGTVEFSPVYPNTIRMQDVAFAQCSLKDVYAEFDFIALLENHRLKLKELYLDGLKCDGATLDSLSAALSINRVEIDALRLNDTPVDFAGLKSPAAALHLNGLELDRTGAVNFNSGRIQFASGSIFDHPLKNTALEFTRDSNRIELKSIYTQLLGGMLSGSASYSLDDGSLRFDHARAEDLILTQRPALADAIRLSFDELSLENAVVSGDHDRLLLQNLSGTVTNLNLAQSDPDFAFKGSAADISLPEYGISLTEAGLDLTKNGELYAFDLKGGLFSGTLQASGSFDRAASALRLNNLDLSQQKLALTEQRIKLIQDLQEKGFSLELENASFSRLELLSYLDSLPLSIRSLSGTAAGLRLGSNSIEGAPAALINGQLQSLLYSDFYVSEAKLIANITSDLITLSVPQLTFRESGLTLSGALSRNGGQSYLIASASNFETSELNSSLFAHLFSGKADFSLDLKGSGEISRQNQNLTGTFAFDSPSLLISKLGLDLINGGKKRNYDLSLDELAAALADADVGLNDFHLRTRLDNGQLMVNATGETATGRLNCAYYLKLADDALSGLGRLDSFSADSATEVRLGGTLDQPRFVLRAVKRGELRPGLYLQQEGTTTPPEEIPQIKQVQDQAAAISRLIKLLPAAGSTISSARERAAELEAEILSTAPEHADQESTENSGSTDHELKTADPDPAADQSAG